MVVGFDDGSFSVLRVEVDYDDCPSLSSTMEDTVDRYSRPIQSTDTVDRYSVSDDALATIFDDATIATWKAEDAKRERAAAERLEARQRKRLAELKARFES